MFISGAESGACDLQVSGRGWKNVLWKRLSDIGYEGIGLWKEGDTGGRNIFDGAVTGILGMGVDPHLGVAGMKYGGRVGGGRSFVTAN